MSLCTAVCSWLQHCHTANHSCNLQETSPAVISYSSGCMRGNCPGFQSWPTYTHLSYQHARLPPAASASATPASRPASTHQNAGPLDLVTAACLLTKLHCKRIQIEAELAPTDPVTLHITCVVHSLTVTHYAIAHCHQQPEAKKARSHTLHLECPLAQ